jgi:hypothetical protein
MNDRFVYQQKVKELMRKTKIDYAIPADGMTDGVIIVVSFVFDIKLIGSLTIRPIPMINKTSNNAKIYQLTRFEQRTDGLLAFLLCIEVSRQIHDGSKIRKYIFFSIFSLHVTSSIVYLYYIC